MEKLPRLFWVLFAGTFINRVGSFVIPLIAIYLTQELGYSPTRAGIVCSLWGAGSLCSGLVGGMLADRIGRRATMLLGLVWGAVAMLLVPHAHGFGMLALAAFQLGLAGDLYRPAMQAQVSDICTPALRPRAYGLLYWAVNLGFAVATTVGGLLARYGFGRLFIADAATTLAFAAIVLAVVPETRPTSVVLASGRLRDALSDRLLLRFAGTQLLVSLVFTQAQTALPVALLRHGIGPSTYGLVMAQNGLIIIILQPVWIRFVGRFERTRVLALTALVVGVGFSLNALPFGVVGAVLSVAIWTVGEILASPVVPSLIADISPTALRGRYQGVLQMGFGLSALVGPTGGMAILERSGSTALWMVCLGAGGIAALLHLGSARAIQERLR